MSVKGPERDPELTCNTEGCHAWATKQSDRKRCSTCGGMSTGPKTEEGKKKSRMNSLETGLHADPVGLFDWLVSEEPEATAWILNKLYDYSQRAPEAVYSADFDEESVESFDDVEVHLTSYGDDLMHMCIRDYARWRAAKRQLEEGIISEQEELTEHGVWTTEDSNPVNLDLDRMDTTVIRQKDKLGVMPSPEKKQAAASEELATVMQRVLEPQD